MTAFGVVKVGASDFLISGTADLLAKL